MALSTPLRPIWSRKRTGTRKKISKLESLPPHLVSHVLHFDTGHDLELVVPDSNEDPVDPLVDPVDVELGEDDHVLGVDGAVRNPVLLRERRGGVHHEFASLHGKM